MRSTPRKRVYSERTTCPTIFDQRCQSRRDFLLAAKTLRNAAENNQQDAALTLLAAVIGLPSHLVSDVPLMRHASHDWLLVLDEATGYIKTSLDAMAPDAAQPSNAENAAVAASRICVKPLPEFLHRVVAAAAEANPDARTIGGLFPNAVMDACRHRMGTIWARNGHGMGTEAFLAQKAKRPNTCKCLA